MKIPSIKTEDEYNAVSKPGQDNAERKTVSTASNSIQFM